MYHCLDFKNSAKKLISEEEYSWKKETLEPVNRSYEDKWKNELTRSEIKIIEAINHNFIDKFNLNYFHKRPKKLVVLFYSIISKLFLVIYKLFRQ